MANFWITLGLGVGVLIVLTVLQFKLRVLLWKKVFALLPRAFLSYRRKDLLQVAPRIRDALMLRHGIASIFRDEDDIAVGANSLQLLNFELAQATVVIVLIGPEWSSVCRDGSDTPSYLLENDWIKLEFETATRLGLKVIPILVDCDNLPTIDDSPEWVQSLFKLQNFQIRTREPDFTQGLQVLSNLVSHDETSQPEKVRQVLWTDVLTAIPMLSVALGLIVAMASVVGYATNLSTHLEAIEDNSTDIAILRDDLRIAQQVAPFDLEEFANSSIKATDIAKGSLFVSDVVVASDQRYHDKITFEPLDAKDKCRMNATFTDLPAITDMRKIPGKKLRIASRIQSGSGKVVEADLITWWELEPSN